MESDAEYNAYQTIVKNDKRQRLAIFLLLVVVLVAVLSSLAYVARSQSDLVSNAQKDGRTRTEENRRYITCLLVLPLAGRDATGQKYCFDQSDLPGGRKSDEFTPIEVNIDDAAAVNIPTGIQDQAVVFVPLSLPDTTPKAQESQPEISQAPLNPPVQPEEQPVPQPSLLEQLTRPLTNLIERIL